MVTVLMCQDIDVLHATPDTLLKRAYSRHTRADEAQVLVLTALVKQMQLLEDKLTVIINKLS